MVSDLIFGFGTRGEEIKFKKVLRCDLLYHENVWSVRGSKTVWTKIFLNHVTSDLIRPARPNH
jgi:hypothetical protein